MCDFGKRGAGWKPSTNSFYRKDNDGKCSVQPEVSSASGPRARSVFFNNLFYTFLIVKIILRCLAPLQLSEKVLWIHSARFYEVLATAGLYPDARDLKSTCNVQNNCSEGAQHHQTMRRVTLAAQNL